MRMQGLKFHISTTLVMLLTMGMVLVIFVALMLWQRDLLRMERLAGSRLAMTLAVLEPDTLLSRLSSGSLLDAGGADCVMVLAGDGAASRVFPADCERAEELGVTVRQAATSNRVVDVVFPPGRSLFSPGSRWIISAAPLGLGSKRSGAVGLVMEERATIRSLLENKNILFVYLLINVLILTVVGFFRLVKFVVRPIEKLVALTESYSDDVNGISFLALSEKNEFGRLSSALNRMMQRIETDREKLQATVTSLKEANRRLRVSCHETVRTEKMASVGRLAAGLAHEIGNPLGIIQGYLDLLQDDRLTGDERNEFISRADRELQRIHQLIRRLLDFSRPAPPTATEVALHPLISDLVDMVQVQPRLREIEIRTILEAKPDLVRGNPDQFKQVLLNCLFNAADAVLEKDEEQGRIIIKTENVGEQVDRSKEAAQGKAYVRVTVEDNGIGIADADLPVVFDPFFTTKDPGRGTGLGLSVSHAIVENMGGRITAASTEGEGTRIIMELPVGASGSPARDPREDDER